MKAGMLGLTAPTIGAPKLGGRGMGPPAISSAPPMSKGLAGGSSIQSATTTGGAPMVKNLGAKIIAGLRARRRGMGAPRGSRRL
jgi:hypothetical protein